MDVYFWFVIFIPGMNIRDMGSHRDGDLPLTVGRTSDGFTQVHNVLLQIGVLVDWDTT
jgi:hypothetical protein